MDVDLVQGIVGIVLGEGGTDEEEGEEGSEQE
jgi:hypothetical protein